MNNSRECWPFKNCGKCKKYYSSEAFSCDSKSLSGLYSTCRSCVSAKVSIRQKKLRMECISGLGGECKSCFYKEDIRALNIDHVNGGGKEDRKSSGGIDRYYKRVLKSILNSENKYQLLCCRCNTIKITDNNEIGSLIIPEFLTGINKNSKKCKICLKIYPKNFFREYKQYYKNKTYLTLNYACKKCSSERWSSSAKETRQEAILRLGNKCNYCSYDADVRALALDHINGGGHEEKRLLSPKAYYEKILTDQSGKYQVLCSNCNFIKLFENDERKKKNFSIWLVEKKEIL